MLPLTAMVKGGGVTLKWGTADYGTCRPPEPAEPHRNREISRLPKLRALGNAVAFSVIQTFHFRKMMMRTSETLFRPISVSTAAQA